MNPAAFARLRHVLLILDGFPKSLGGGERIALRIAALLPQFGYRATILTFFLHPETAFTPADAPCPVYLLPLQRTYDLQALRGALALGRFLREQNIRLVQTFFESSDLWGGLVTRALSDAKLIWSRRDMGILRAPKHNLAYRWLNRLPHAVFAVSDQVAQHALAVDRIEPWRVRTIYNGLDLEPLAQHGREADRPPVRVVTTLGNIRRVKGHDLFLEAAALVAPRYPELRFTLAGEVLEPEYFQELQQQVRRLGLEEKITFLGKVTDMQAHLRASDIFVLPSRSEGFSNALIEAMASELPVIATDVGGNAEAIQHGISGLIVPPENAAMLAHALLQLLSAPAYARQISIAARQRVEANFTATAMMTSLAQSYGEILGN